MSDSPVIIETIGELSARLDAERMSGCRVGFVPTMGFLHAGHRSLMDRARIDNDVLVASIFINPLQFSPDEDLDAYPRDLSGDTELCGAAGVDLLFVPAADEMYPAPLVTTVSVGELSAVLEGVTRPTHFDGVVTVVAKLFAIVGPCSAYFGEKDFQQLVVIRRMVSDLSLPVGVVGCPTVRESDGLALSSRNLYLTEEEREQAPVLRRALDAGRVLVDSGERDPHTIETRMAAVISSRPLADLDYAAAVPADTLVADGLLDGEIRLLVAARFGRARLIDNEGCVTR